MKTRLEWCEGSGDGRRSQAADEEVAEQIGDGLRACGTLWTVPARDPVDGAKQREGEKLRIAACEDAGLHAFLEDAADALVERIASGNDRLEVGRRERFEVEKQRGAVQFVEDRMDERVNQASQLDVRRRSAGVDL